MDSLNLGFFLAAAFFGGLTSGLSGFAMGLVVSGVWLHIISPEQNALLIVLCGLVTQGSGIWRVRRAIEWRAVAPLIAGSALGVPAGTALLATIDRNSLRIGIGVLLLIYSLYSLLPAIVQADQGRHCARPWRRYCKRPDRRTDRAGRDRGDHLVPIARRPQGRATRHLSARDVRNLSDERDCARRRRRIHHRDAETLCSRTPRSGCRYLGGLKLYGKLDDAAFRKVILLLLLASGLSLIVPVR